MKIQKIKMGILFPTFCCSFFLNNAVIYAQPNIEHQEHSEQIASNSSTSDIANFTTATTTNVNGRIWYSNIVSMNIGNGLMTILGDNRNDWGSFGIDPGWNGRRGLPINTNGYSYIAADMDGNASSLKLELYDREGNKDELWIEGTSFKLELPNRIKNGYISKLQFVTGPGAVNIRIGKIYLTN